MRIAKAILSIISFNFCQVVLTCGLPIRILIGIRRIYRRPIEFFSGAFPAIVFRRAQLGGECTPVHLRQRAGKICEGTTVNIVMTNARWRPFDVRRTLYSAHYSIFIFNWHSRALFPIRMRASRI